jgi:hypothetical protein
MAAIGASTWSQLLGLKSWVRLSTIGVSAQRLADTLYKVDDEKYLRCVPYDPDMNPLETDLSISGVVWAETDGGAQRSILHLLESDDKAGGVPPPEMLLDGADGTYGKVLGVARSGPHGKVLETAVYRPTDGKFVDRTIALPHWTYHYRGREDRDDEPCYAIEYRLPRRGASTPSL